MNGKTSRTVYFCTRNSGVFSVFCDPEGLECYFDGVNKKLVPTNYVILMLRSGYFKSIFIMTF
jgi:hypothetical protein